MFMSEYQRIIEFSVWTLYSTMTVILTHVTRMDIVPLWRLQVLVSVIRNSFLPFICFRLGEYDENAFPKWQWKFYESTKRIECCWSLFRQINRYYADMLRIFSEMNMRSISFFFLFKKSSALWIEMKQEIV